MEDDVSAVGAALQSDAELCHSHAGSKALALVLCRVGSAGAKKYA